LQFRGDDLNRILVWLSWMVIIMLGELAQAQTLANDAVVFVWNDRLYAQALTSSELVQTTAPPSQAPYEMMRYGNAFTSAQSGLAAPPPDAYGFYQGVWSVDGARLAYLALQPNDAGYHIVLAQGDEQRILFSGTVSAERGYLVPIGWAQDGTLMLLERHMLHNLAAIKVWSYNTDATLSLRYEITVPALKGNSASLDGGWVFVGLDTVGMLGYLLNINSGQVVTFRTGLALEDPPASVFETYPLDVIGVVNLDEFKAWSTRLRPAPDQPTQTTPTLSAAAWLHWPLPDYARSITCYPDSEWTDLQYAVECPGLTVPREYSGHEGTDIGGKPAGLELGTPVYAAARGLAVNQLSDCAPLDITCGDAYGNYVLLEHARVVEQDVETWFTGYAHLQDVLVDQFAYVREIGIPIALSGDTGLGGAHLHFEVRAPHQPIVTNWLDPWDTRQTTDGMGLWLGGVASPLAAITAAPPPTLLICQTVDGNNIRSGPGTEYAVVGQTTAQTRYEVFQAQTLTSGGTPGEWYHMRWMENQVTGWIWADLMASCTPPA
jgi:murein DD-endopeptidase MepM/ murein hydrolase activator NlpD